MNRGQERDGDQCERFHQALAPSFLLEPHLEARGPKRLR
jgi:hypothetical protein